MYNNLQHSRLASSPILQALEERFSTSGLNHSSRFSVIIVPRGQKLSLQNGEEITLDLRAPIVVRPMDVITIWVNVITKFPAKTWGATCYGDTHLFMLCAWRTLFSQQRVLLHRRCTEEHKAWNFIFVWSSPDQFDSILGIRPSVDSVCIMHWGSSASGGIITRAQIANPQFTWPPHSSTKPTFH